MMKANYNNTLKPLFKYTGKAHVKLNKIQTLTRDRVQQKINAGIYKLEDIPCICGSKDDVVIAETDRYGLPLNMVICTNCGLLRTNPRPDSSSLDLFYSSEYRNLYMGPPYSDMQSYFCDMVERGRSIFSLIKKYAPQVDFSQMEVLEIGCSAGGVLLPFLEAGASVKGLDYDERYLTYGNGHNPSLNLHFGGIESLKGEGPKYDLILINHVLEHLHDPKSALQAIRNNLKMGGILYVSVPGLRNPAYYLSPTKSFLGAVHIGHLFIFSKLLLLRLLKEFEVLYIDDQVRAVCRSGCCEYRLEENLASDYFPNIEFITKYEKSLLWKIKRLGIALKSFPAIIKLILSNNNEFSAMNENK